jgi:SAM-dependent methyltransferase
MAEICKCCGSNKNKHLFARSDELLGKHEVIQCRNCGLIYADPIPALDFLRNHYNEHFFTKKFDFVESGIIWENFYNLNMVNIEKFKTKGKLLEVGCGLGHFLNAAKKRSWETYGVELSEFAANYAVKNFGLNVFNGSLEEAKLPDGQFDVVVLWATLEHLVNPFQNLLEIHRVLAPQGLLAFSVPNHNSFFTQLYGVSKTDMLHYEHLYHFPFGALKIGLGRIGFKGLRRMVIFGGGPDASRIQDLIQFAARVLNIGSETRVIAFKK